MVLFGRVEGSCYLVMTVPQSGKFQKNTLEMQFSVYSCEQQKSKTVLLFATGGGLQRFLGNIEIEGSGTHERLERKNHGESQNRRGKRGEVQPMAFKK